jgi:hypothetical protein
LEHDFPNNKAGLFLLDAMIANPSFGNDEPSQGVVSLIDRIETADPNSPEFDEDDLGTSWGHAQFKEWRVPLVSWSSIGNDAACCLIASFIRTCRVSRHLVTSTGQSTKGKSFLSDGYLDNLTDLLWELRQKAEVSLCLPK